MNTKVETKTTVGKRLLESVKAVFSKELIVSDFKQLSSKDKGLLAVLLLTQVGAFIFANDFTLMGWIGLVTGVTTIISLIMVNKGLISNYVWGTIGTFVWLVIALSHNLYGDVATQTYYFVMQFVGIYVWHKMMSDENSGHVSAKKMTAMKAFAVLVFTIVIYGIVLFTSKQLGGAQVILDSALLPLGIIGQLLMTYGYRSQWVFWITINVINVVIWFNQIKVNPSAISMFVLQIMMLINSIYGAYQWFTDDEN